MITTPPPTGAMCRSMALEGWRRCHIKTLPRLVVVLVEPPPVIEQSTLRELTLRTQLIRLHIPREYKPRKRPIAPPTLTSAAFSVLPITLPIEKKYWPEMLHGELHIPRTGANPVIVTAPVSKGNSLLPSMLRRSTSATGAVVTSAGSMSIKWTRAWTTLFLS